MGGEAVGGTAGVCFLGWQGVEDDAGEVDGHAQWVFAGGIEWDGELSHLCAGAVGAVNSTLL